MELLQGQALSWARALSTRFSLNCLTFDDLEVHLKAMFDHLNYVSDAMECLLAIQQGARSVDKYAVEFLTLVVEEG